MSTKYHVSSKGVLGLKTNVDKVKWSWGVNMPESTRQEYDACAVRLALNVDDEQAKPEPSTLEHGKYHYFSGRAGADSLSYERTFMGRRNLNLRLSGLVEDETVLTVNRDYLRFVTHRFMNLHSAGYILTDVAALKLLHSGYAPLHCSGFRYGAATVLVLAPPNTGKTLTTMMACLDDGAEFIAEDLAITDGTQLFSVPWTSTFRYYDRVDDSRRSRMLNKATQMMPLLELLPLGKTDGIDTLLAPEKIVTDYDITHVIILERGSESVEVVEAGEAERKAINLNRYEFNYVKAPALVAYEFFNPAINLDEAAAQERSILRKAVNSASERLIVRTTDPTRYASLILNHLRK